jgi:hypothetical protein
MRALICVATNAIAVSYKASDANRLLALRNDIAITAGSLSGGGGDEQKHKLHDSPVAKI